MSYIKKYHLQSEDGSGWGGGSFNVGTGSWSGSSNTNSYDPYNPTSIGFVGPSPDTSPTPSVDNGAYQSDFLKSLFDDPDTNWKTQPTTLTALDTPLFKSWGDVKEAQGVLKNIPSSEGIFGNVFNQQYGADGSELGLQTSPFGEKAWNAIRGVANLNPYGKLANMGADIYNGVNPLRVAANSIPGNLGAVSRMGADVAGGAGVGETVGKNIGGTVGGYGASNFANNILGGGLVGALGGMFAGKAGADSMSQVGQQVGDQVGGMMKTAYNPTTTGTNMADTPSFMSKWGSFFGGDTPAQTPGINPTVAAASAPQPLQTQSPFGSVLGGLAGLYTGNQAINGMQQQQQALQQQQATLQQPNDMPSLAEMYGPNSPYALQMRQTLARKDAAAGRNSQYGAREAQLQALLADKASQYAAQRQQGNSAQQQATMANAQALNNMNLQQQQIRAQQLGGLFDMGNRTGLNSAIGSGLGSLYNSAAPAIYNMFNGGGSTAPTPSYYENA